MATAQAISPERQLMSTRQVLVRFQDATYPVYVPFAASMNLLSSYLPKILSERTGWPKELLAVTSQRSSLPFADVRVRSSIRGGKGGFGTLLKGQSRKAGAKLTTDFGACRDLQGRRLRHVNDEIKLRKWREMQRKKENGEATSKDLVESMYDTPSGLYNWHLMTPTWADVSKKATYRIKRQFQMMDREEEKRREAKQQKAQALQNSITHYAEQAAKATQSVQASVSDALRQGLESQPWKRKRESKQLVEPIEKPDQDTQPHSLCTLSGEMVVEDVVVSANDEKKRSVMQIQSKSDFGTVVLVLDKNTIDRCLYYEVKLVTAGIAQVGWASLLGDRTFAPDDDTGDGVGDDAASYAFDGSRSLKFHGGAEESYGKLCAAGDVIGCKYDVATGVVSFSINGENMGEAFRAAPQTQLFPALSCNMGEILEMHIREVEFIHMPQGVTPIYEMLANLEPQNNKSEIQQATRPAKQRESEPTDNGTNGENTKEGTQSQKVAPSPVMQRIERPKDSEILVKPEPLDLEKFSSAKELESLGMERLKCASMALQIKCGGSLKERASRLWSIRGLERKDFPARIRANNFVV